MIDLPAHFEGVKQTGPDRYLARCSAHDDTTPSLSLRLVDGRWLIHDFGGCHASDVLAAVGLEMHDLLIDKPCRECGKEFHPLHPDHDLCAACFKGQPDTYHRRRPRTPRIPAGDILQAIDFETLVVSIIAADMVEQKEITPETWARLATAASRIGAARDMCR